MTTYYVDPSVASAAASTNEAAPGNSIANALTAATGANDSILLARGYIYEAASSLYGTVTVSGKNPATRLLISSYVADSLPTATARPIINGMTWEPPSGATGWTLVSGSIWKKAFSGPVTTYPAVMRVIAGAYLTGSAANNSIGTGWVEGIAQRRAGVASNATEAALLAAIDETSTWGWTSDGTDALYMYSSPTQDPPTYYGGLGICGGGNGSSWGHTQAISVLNSSNIEIDGIDMFAGSADALLIKATTAACANVVVRNSIMHYGAKFGFRAIGAAGFLVTNGYAYNVEMHGHALDAEDWNIDAGTLDWLNGPNEHFSIKEYVEGFVLARCRSYGARHACFTINPTAAAHSTTKNVIFMDCEVDNSGSKYGRAMSWANTRDEYGNGFYRISVVNCTQLFQGWGRITIDGIIAFDFQPTYDAFIGYNSVTGEGMPGMSFFWGDDYTPAAGALVVRNVTCDNARWYPIHIYGDPSLGAATAGAIEMTNVIINDTLYRAGRSRAAGVPEPTRTAYYQSDKSLLGIIKYTNCLIDSGPDNGGNIVMEQIVGAFTYSTLAALTGAAGNIEETAELDANLFPASDTANVVAAGVHTGYKVDARRTQFWNPPTIGAFEFQRARTARL